MDDLPPALQSVYDALLALVTRFQRQYDRMARELSGSMLTRIGLIIAVYITIRPFYVRFIEWTHKKGEENKERKKKEAKKAARAKAKVSANTLRTGKPSEQPVDSDSDDSEIEEVEVVSTGAVLDEDQVDRKARRLRRRIDRARLDKEEMRKFEEEEWNDPDVSDLLVGRA